MQRHVVRCVDLCCRFGVERRKARILKLCTVSAANQAERPSTATRTARAARGGRRPSGVQGSRTHTRAFYLRVVRASLLHDLDASGRARAAPTRCQNYCTSLRTSISRGARMLLPCFWPSLSLPVPASSELQSLSSQSALHIHLLAAPSCGLSQARVNWDTHL